MKKGGCWIFLSHSSHDIEKVRMVRNEFEAQGQNPLAFHLRCLSTETTEGRDELDNLIKREIDSREWFVFCDSPDAKKAEYVQMEMDYIKSRGDKKIWSIDMTEPIEKILETVREICVKLKVFISFSNRNMGFVEKLEAKLIEKDYSVWTTNQLTLTGGSWFEQIKTAIDDASKNGFCLLVVTEAYKRSQACMYELKEILKTDAEIIPILIGNTTRPEELRGIPCYSIPEEPKDEDMHLIVELIEEKLKSEIRGPVRIQADLFNKIAEIQEKLNYQKRYHSKEAVHIGNTGPLSDYCEIYEFPCCGRRVVVGDGPVSRYRADGCVIDE